MLSVENAPPPGPGKPERPGVAGWLERARRSRDMRFPNWPRTRTAQFIRRILQAMFVLPIARGAYAFELRGRENFALVSEPCLVISNHNMHIDQSILLRAMPPGFRHRIAIAASETDMFGNPVKGFLTALLGNAFPFARQGGGVRDSLEYVAIMLREGWHVLLFPEGKLTVIGPMQPFKGGVGLLARQLGVPVLPMRIDVLKPGLQEGNRVPIFRGQVRVSVGAPLRIEKRMKSDEATALLEAAVRDA